MGGLTLWALWPYLFFFFKLAVRYRQTIFPLPSLDSLVFIWVTLFNGSALYAASRPLSTWYHPFFFNRQVFAWQQRMPWRLCVRAQAKASYGSLRRCLGGKRSSIWMYGFFSVRRFKFVKSKPIYQYMLFWDRLSGLSAGGRLLY